MSMLLRALWGSDWLVCLGRVRNAQQRPWRDDPDLSRGLSGLLVLGCFCPDGRYRGVADVARMLEMSASIARRYVRTLVAVGLDREPESRKYEIARTG
jgi:hypothetical protein